MNQLPATSSPPSSSSINKKRSRQMICIRKENEISNKQYQGNSGETYAPLSIIERHDSRDINVTIPILKPINSTPSNRKKQVRFGPNSIKTYQSESEEDTMDEEEDEGIALTSYQEYSDNSDNDECSTNDTEPLLFRSSKYHSHKQHQFEDGNYMNYIGEPEVSEYLKFSRENINKHLAYPYSMMIGDGPLFNAVHEYHKYKRDHTKKPDDGMIINPLSELPKEVVERKYQTYKCQFTVWIRVLLIVCIFLFIIIGSLIACHIEYTNLCEKSNTLGLLLLMVAISYLLPMYTWITPLIQIMRKLKFMGSYLQESKEENEIERSTDLNGSSFIDIDFLVHDHCDTNPATTPDLSALFENGVVPQIQPLSQRSNTTENVIDAAGTQSSPPNLKYTEREFEDNLYYTLGQYTLNKVAELNATTNLDTILKRKKGLEILGQIGTNHLKKHYFFQSIRKAVDNFEMEKQKQDQFSKEAQCEETVFSLEKSNGLDEMRKTLSDLNLVLNTGSIRSPEAITLLPPPPKKVETLMMLHSTLRLIPFVLLVPIIEKTVKVFHDIREHIGNAYDIPDSCIAIVTFEIILLTLQIFTAVIFFMPHIFMIFAPVGDHLKQLKNQLTRKML